MRRKFEQKALPVQQSCPADHRQCLASIKRPITRRAVVYTAAIVFSLTWRQVFVVAASRNQYRLGFQGAVHDRSIFSISLWLPASTIRVTSP